MNLYDLSEAYREALEAAVDAETGEIADAKLGELLDAVEAKLETRALDVAAYVTELDLEAEAIDRRAADLKARSVALYNRAESLRRYLVSCLAVGTKLKDSRVTLSVAPGKLRVEVPNLAKLDPLYVRTMAVADKRAIQAAWDQGLEIAGAVPVMGPPSVRIK